jgi:hypothetical protein
LFVITSEARDLLLNLANQIGRAIGILVCALLVCATSSAQSKALLPAKLDRICGKLERTQTIAEKKNPSFVHIKSKSLPASELKLITRTNDRPCCSLGPVASVKTNHWGHFEFKMVAAGNYWLITTVDGKDVRMPIEFKPDKHSTTLCTDQFFDVDENYNFAMSLTVTVD